MNKVFTRSRECLTNRISEKFGFSKKLSRYLCEEVLCGIANEITEKGSINLPNIGTISIFKASVPTDIASDKRKNWNIISMRGSEKLKQVINEKNIEAEKKRIAKEVKLSVKIKEIPKKVKPLFPGKKYKR